MRRFSIFLFTLFAFLYIKHIFIYFLVYIFCSDLTLNVRKFFKELEFEDKAFLIQFRKDSKKHKALGLDKKLNRNKLRSDLE
jgi:hypothetical protein